MSSEYGRWRAILESFDDSWKRSVFGHALRIGKQRFKGEIFEDFVSYVAYRLAIMQGDGRRCKASLRIKGLMIDFFKHRNRWSHYNCESIEYLVSEGAEPCYNELNVDEELEELVPACDFWYWKLKAEGYTFKEIEPLIDLNVGFNVFNRIAFYKRAYRRLKEYHETQRTDCGSFEGCSQV